MNRPNVSKHKPSSSAAQKRKGVSSQGDYKFEFNPLLKLAQTQDQQPTYKPTNQIIIDLNPTSSADLTYPMLP